MTIATTHQVVTLRKPDLATDRPQARAPIYHQIPAELQARAQWVLWRYERKNDKWTKVPYQPNLSPAATSRPRTWSTFADAKAAYLARPDYFDGIGYVFSKTDPYCGADFDHCIGDDSQISIWAAAHLATLRAAGAYIEISVSGSGIHAITRATFGKGRKTTRGEIYDRGRFFTISGRALDPTPIGDGQTAIDALRADLGSSSKADTPTRDGTAGNGDRAALAASHPAAEWEEARQLLRTERNLLLQRSLAATKFEKTHKGDVNQGYYAARSLWPELHQRWPHIGLYRDDGSLDDSQARAVLARTLYGRGFSFPEYVVIMSHHFAAYCLAKWGTREMWREELAACWQYAITHTAYQPKAPTPTTRPDVAISAKPRGRASDHAAQVKRVDALLQEHRAGAQAIVNTSELASAADMHRVTLASILKELRDSGRITTRRNGRYGGLIVSFSDVAIVATAAPEFRATTAETPIEAPAAIEETKISCVTSKIPPADYSLPMLAELAAVYLDTPDIGALVTEAIEAYGTRYIPGQAKPVERVIAYVLANGAEGITPEVIALAYTERLQARRWARADEREAAKARKLGKAALKRQSLALATQAAAVERACRTGVQLPEVLTFEHNGRTYTTPPGKAPTRRYAAWLRRRAGIYAAEEARRQPEIELTTHELWAQVDMAAYHQARKDLRLTKPIKSAVHLTIEPTRRETIAAEADYVIAARTLADRLRQRPQIAANA